MRRAWAARFPLDPSLVMLNHASYGLAPTEMLHRAEAVRHELESDPNVSLGPALGDRLRATLSQVCADLGLDPRRTAMTSSATAAAAALQQSIPLSAGDVVLTLDCEYSSVIRGWRRRCDAVGAELRVVQVALPLLDAGSLLADLGAAAGPDPISVVQLSAVTSSAALRLPVGPVAAWARSRGAVVVVDAAHGPGHIDVAGWAGVDAVFGTLHKWLPVPRSVGILWVGPRLRPVVRPAEVSLTWDEELLADRFAWPGTYDPAVRLCLPDAMALHARWVLAGEVGRCERLADHAVEALIEVGAVALAGPGLGSPRLRAVLLDGVAAPALRQRLLDAGIRAWTGPHGDDGSLLRVATHVYNDEGDVDSLTKVVTTLLTARRARR
jgi:isopenicillin-N epimerase